MIIQFDHIIIILKMGRLRKEIKIMEATWKPAFADPSSQTFLKEKGTREEAVSMSNIIHKVTSEIE